MNKTEFGWSIFYLVHFLHNIWHISHTSNLLYTDSHNAYAINIGILSSGLANSEYHAGQIFRFTLTIKVELNIMFPAVSMTYFVINCDTKSYLTAVALFILFRI